MIPSLRGSQLENAAGLIGVGVKTLPSAVYWNALRRYNILTHDADTSPANPVDFEQREGRVDRYRGHAVRRNIAARHATSILANPGRDAWFTAFAMATEYQHKLDDFSPSWVYTGPAKIQRHAAPFALALMGSVSARSSRTSRSTVWLSGSPARRRT